MRTFHDVEIMLKKVQMGNVEGCFSLNVPQTETRLEVAKRRPCP